MKSYFFFYFLSVITTSLCFGQSDSTYYYFERSTPESQISNRILNSKDNYEINYYKLIYFSKQRNIDSMFKYVEINEKNEEITKGEKAAKLLYFKAYTYRISQNDSLSYLYHYKALTKAREINDTITQLAALSGLSQSSGFDNIPYRLDYLKELDLAANKFGNRKYKIVSKLLTGNYFLLRDSSKKAIEYYKDILNLKFSSTDSIQLINTLNNIGTLFQEQLNQPDSAIYYYNKKLEVIESNSSFQYPSNYFSLYNNIGRAYESMDKPHLAKSYYLKADSIPIIENVLFNKSIIKENLGRISYTINDYKNAYRFQTEYQKLIDSIRRDEQGKTITRYDNERLRAEKAESENERLESEAKRKQTQNIAIGLGGSLALGSIIALLLFKNTKRKQKLAEQDKEIESQKLATVLKEQELTAIDAMIAGQEKERQRIANDLHDDLGGLMATVKLHFNALKDKDSPELFDKTNSLIEEAYQKVRTVAHAKNSGVIAKQGLLKAVENMAEKITASNKLYIEVLDHGLDNRLENSLELTLFRIIQELITNVIKHAEATEATIHLTNHEDSINIMVEDNGKGFNPSQITKTNKGMGISSIDKRIEHLEGYLTIESEENKGTTVIIDIPL